jgi:hypothetical protein
MNIIQDDSGGNINNWGGDRIGHCEKKNYMNVCLILISYQDRAVSIYKYKSIVNGNKEREITFCWFNFNFNLRIKWQICYTEITNVLQFTINVKKSHRQPQCTLQLVREKITCCSSELIFTFLYAGSSIQMPASNSSRVSTFLLLTSLFIQPHKKKNLTELDLEIQTALSR